MLVEKGFVAFRADVTDADANHPAYALMRDLGNENMELPFVAVIPHNTPDQPILFKGSVTKEQFLEVLRQIPPLPPASKR
jgi:thiol:disulfide interchange protein